MSNLLKLSSTKVGYGLMSLTAAPKAVPFPKAIDSMHHVIDKYNVGFLNGGDFYGPNNLGLKLIKEFIASNTAEYNKNLIFSVKGGMKPGKFIPDGSKELIDKSISNIISFFPKDPAVRPKIIYEVARRDPNIPYEETIGYIAEHVKAGEIDGISLSEVGVDSIVKAAETFPISCVELELSLFSQDIIHNGILAELSKRKIPIIAYSPLGKGLLTDHTVDAGESFIDSIPKGDHRLFFDRFNKKTFKHNLQIAKKLQDFAHNKKKISLEALALSWILKISQLKQFEGIENVTKILPIPSGSTKEKIDNNFASLLELTDEDFAEIQEITKDGQVKGLRYNKVLERLNFA